MTEPEQGVLILSAPQSLLRLRRQEHGVRSLRIEAVGIDPERVQGWQRRLAKDYFACGCIAGQAGTAVGLGLCGVTAFVAWPQVTVSPFVSAAYGIGIMTLCAFGLRGLSLLQTRTRLRRSIDAVMREWTAGVGVLHCPSPVLAGDVDDEQPVAALGGIGRS